MATNDNKSQENTTSGPSLAPANAAYSDPGAVSAKDRMLILTIVIILLILAAMAIVGFLFIKPGPDTVQGQADATEIRISGKLPGRVTEIFVEEGQRVKEGDTLVRIHSTLAEAKLYQAEAMENAASATNRKVDAGTRSQIINGAHDIWRQAQAATGITKKTYERMQNLLKRESSASRREMRQKPPTMQRSPERVLPKASMSLQSRVLRLKTSRLRPQWSMSPKAV